MTFDDLEKTWNAQRLPAVRSRDRDDVKRHLASELKRRRRFFCYEFFCLVFGLLTIPGLAVLNFFHERPDSVVLYWVRGVLVLLALLAFLIGAIRRFRRHQVLSEATTNTISAVVVLSLESVEAEIRDCRAMQWALLIWLGLALFSIYVNQPISKLGWAPFTARASMVLGFGLVVGWVFWRHQRKCLEPERTRRMELLQQLR